jgi:hypothetical protein
MTIARLKPDLLAADLALLEHKVRALFSAWAARGRTGFGWASHNTEDTTWPELIALCRSIQGQPGWQLWVTGRGQYWEQVALFLHTPGLAFRSIRKSISSEPNLGALPYSMIDAIYDAAKARYAADRNAVPDESERSGSVVAWKAAVAAIRSSLKEIRHE